MTAAATALSSLPADTAGVHFEALPGQQTRTQPLPLVVRPGGSAHPDTALDWLRRDRDQVRALLQRHGALLFRGFSVAQVAAFEQIARAIDPGLQRRYLGTSPRNALSDHVFTASELPPYYPIPFHCEMSFLQTPPQHLFFWCMVAPRGPGGETPLCDMRQVYRQLDPALRQRFETRGLRIIRNYSGPSERRRFHGWQLKRWDEMFQTTSHQAVEATCREQGFAPTWKEDNALRLVSDQPAVRVHPVSGEPVWFNHASVFHLWAAPTELSHIARRQRRLQPLMLTLYTRAMVAIKRRLTHPLDQAMHVTFGDGSEIPDADIEAIHAVLWQNMVAFPWQVGDVLALDNRAIAHGRLPYRGPREIAVCFA